ncbi:hypothetical protein OVA14_08635 [Agrococcus sp. SL85]|nr:hypothetical protein [Agrococcus sp. SL85]WAC65434.1 hypothetical protein OVA14_08635 [Agrococcus sp. SL85]
MAVGDVGVIARRDAEPAAGHAERLEHELAGELGEGRARARCQHLLDDAVPGVGVDEGLPRRADPADRARHQRVLAAQHLLERRRRLPVAQRPEGVVVVLDAAVVAQQRPERDGGVRLRPRQRPAACAPRDVRIEVEEPPRHEAEHHDGRDELAHRRRVEHRGRADRALPVGREQADARRRHVAVLAEHRRAEAGARGRCRQEVFEAGERPAVAHDHTWKRNDCDRSVSSWESLTPLSFSGIRVMWSLWRTALDGSSCGLSAD